MSLYARLLRALGALVVTVGISAGVPWWLLTYVGNPVPRHIPSLAQASQWLTSGRFDIHTALAVVVHILWGCWAVFVAQVLVQVPGIVADVVRVLRHREPLRRDALGGPGGTLVRALVAAFTIALIAPRSAVPQAAAKASGFISAASARPVASGPVLPGSREGTHTVQQGESLWGIAEEELGAGAMWPTIYEASVGREQPDGRRLTDPGLIEPGWTLTVPKPHATPPAAVTGQAPGPVKDDAATPPIPVPFVPAAPKPVPRAAVPAQGPMVRSAPQQRAVEQFVAPRDRQGVQLPTGGFVGMGLAACLGAAIAACHLLNRHRARLGAGKSAFVPAQAEPIGALHRAHLVALAPPGVGYFQDEDDFDDPYPTADGTPEDLAAYRPLRLDGPRSPNPIASGVPGLDPIALRVWASSWPLWMPPSSCTSACARGAESGSDPRPRADSRSAVRVLSQPLARCCSPRWPPAGRDRYAEPRSSTPPAAPSSGCSGPVTRSRTRIGSPRAWIFPACWISWSWSSANVLPRWPTTSTPTRTSCDGSSRAPRSGRSSCCTTANTPASHERRSWRTASTSTSSPCGICRSA